MKPVFCYRVHVQDFSAPPAGFLISQTLLMKSSDHLAGIFLSQAQSIVQISKAFWRSLCPVHYILFILPQTVHVILVLVAY